MDVLFSDGIGALLDGEEGDQGGVAANWRENQQERQEEKFQKSLTF